MAQMILKSIFSTNSPSICYFWLTFLILISSISSATISGIPQYYCCSAHFNIQFFIRLSASFPWHPPPPNCLGSTKYIHIKIMLEKIYFLLLCLAEYLVDVSIKCRIHYWICSHSFKSRHTVSLNPSGRANPSTGWRGFLNLNQNRTRITNIPNQI